MNFPLAYPVDLSDVRDAIALDKNGAIIFHGANRYILLYGNFY